jgi:hypothetical protein
MLHQKTMKILAKSTTKPDNEAQRKNEDALMVHTDLSPYQRIALADGAGGYGVFAAEWAEFLCQNLPEKPLCTLAEVDAWLGEHCTRFYETYLPLAQGNTFVSNKFLQEGSAATLVAVWIDETEKLFHFVNIGDSLLFIYDKKSQELFAPKHIESVLFFEQNPVLLNWADEKTNDSQFSAGTYQLVDNQVLILASDATAQWIWLNYLLRSETTTAQTHLQTVREKGFKTKELLENNEKIYNKNLSFELWLDCLAVSLQQDKFEVLMQRQYTKQCVVRDDYTVILYTVA